MGFYLGVAVVFVLKNSDYSLVMMESRLTHSVSSLGILWQSTGEAIEYRGLRAPYYSTQHILLNSLKPGIKEFHEALDRLKPQLTKS